MLPLHPSLPAMQMEFGKRSDLQAGLPSRARPSLDVLHGDTPLCFPQVAAGLNLQIDPYGQLLERWGCMM